MDEKTAYERAKQRVEALKGLYIHSLMFLVVAGGLLLIDYLGGGGWWFFWPVIPIGIAVVIHTLAVFVFEGRLSQQWEERKIREYMKQDSGSRA